MFVLYLTSLCLPSEFFAERDAAHFWQFAESLDGTLLAAIRHSAHALLAQSSPASTALFEFALGLRVYSPRVEAARQSFARSPCADAVAAVAVVDDDVSRAACSPAQLLARLALPAEPPSHVSAVEAASFAFDRRFAGSGGAATTRRRVVLHAALGTPEFLAMHSVLKARALAGDVDYVFRHFDAPADVRLRGKVPLGGFGVELNLKSVEYKSFDDAAVKDAEQQQQQQQEQQQDGDVDAEVLGIRFGTLRSRYPEQAESLTKLQEYLYSRDTGFEELRVWEMQSLGVHAAQRVASAQEPLALLRQLSSEFPTYATSLSRMKTNESFVHELRLMQNYVSEGHANHLVLNGRMIDPRKVDAFQLYGIVAEELNRVAAFDALRIAPVDAARLAAIDLSVARPARFNVPLSRAAVLCDLEADDAYLRWPKTLASFARFAPSWHQQFPTTRRNLFTAVFVLDPTSLLSVYTFSMMQRIVQQRFPLRLAVLLATPAPRADLSAADEVKLAAARAYLAFAGEMSSLDASESGWPGSRALTDAVSLFTATAQVARQYVPIKSVDQLTEAIAMLASNFPDMDLEPAALMRGGDNAARVDAILDGMRNQLADLGLATDLAEPLVFVNGKLVISDDPANSAVREMMEQIETVKQMIMDKLITDDTADM